MNIIFPATLITFISLWIQPAMAYIDPGSGSAIMSAIIGLFVATGLVIKTYWYKLKSMLIGKAPTEAPDSEEKLK
jgi:hypothetical protein